MDSLTKLYRLIISFFEEKIAYLSQNPKSGLLVAIALVTLYIVGLILDWKWTLTPAGSTDMVDKWIEIFGKTTVRFFYGLGALVLLVALIFMYTKH